jgi:hypothetical protein
MKPRHFIPALCLFLLLAYPLSFGPVVRHHQIIQNHGETHTIFLIYRPLFWFCGACRPFGDAFQVYMKLWVLKKDQRSGEK